VIGKWVWLDLKKKDKFKKKKRSCPKKIQILLTCVLKGKIATFDRYCFLGSKTKGAKSMPYYRTKRNYPH
jgi:sRNA-binding regulator protein Hfq